MPSVVRTITRIQDADDFTGSLTDTYIPVWSNAQQKFVMTAQSGGGTPGGSTTQVQYNSSGSFAGDAGMTYDAANDALTVAGRVITPVIRPGSDSTTGIKIQNAAGSTDVVMVDTTNTLVRINKFVLGNGASVGLYMRNGANSADLQILRIDPNNDATFDGVNSFTFAKITRYSADLTNPSAVLGLRGATGVALRDAAGATILYSQSSTARIGIGTTSPNNKLDVVGTVQMDGLRIDSTPTSETIAPTHTFTISLNGTDYKIPCVAV